MLIKSWILRVSLSHCLDSFAWFQLQESLEFLEHLRALQESPRIRIWRECLAFKHSCQIPTISAFLQLWESWNDSKDPWGILKMLRESHQFENSRARASKNASTISTEPNIKSTIIDSTESTRRPRQPVQTVHQIMKEIFQSPKENYKDQDIW